jgi:drug/metabolite transporter (DMT)-like permease
LNECARIISSEPRIAGSSDFSRTTLADWFPVVYSGIVVTVIAFILWFRGLAKVPASTAAVFTGVWPVCAVLLSYLILKEQFAVSHLLGIRCVQLGIALIARDPLQAQDRQAVSDSA